MNEKGEIIKEPDESRIKKDMYAVSVDDAKTKQTIVDAYKKYELLLEPHGSVGWAGLMEYLKDNPDENGEQVYVTLETAHPAKFPAKIQELLGFDPELPKSLEGLEEKPESFEIMKNDYDDFKSYLMENY